MSCLSRIISCSKWFINLSIIFSLSWLLRIIWISIHLDLIVSSNGFGKRSDLQEYREQKRGGKGVFTLKANQKTGKLVSIMEVVDEDDLMIITSQGIMIRQSIKNINIIGRNTQGVKLIRLDEKSSIASVTKVIKEEETENTEEAGQSPNKEES